MEGAGSTRLGRASARYGSTAVFSGPVRKWKKKWVPVSSSSIVKHSQNNGNSSATSSVLLRRWTPLSSADSESLAAASTVDDGDDAEQQPPKRKFRYTPVAVLEEELKKAAAKQVEDEAKTDEKKTNQSPDWLSSESENELNINNDLKKETQDSSMGNLDLGLRLKGHDHSRNSLDEKEGQEKAAGSVEFWTIA